MEQLATISPFRGSSTWLHRRLTVKNRIVMPPMGTHCPPGGGVPLG
jgi:hypothetical protein